MRPKDLTFRILRPAVRRLTDFRRIASISKLAQQLLPNLVIDEDSIVFDLGANRGDFTLYAAKQGALVVAFEPNPYAFKYLANRTHNLGNVILMNAAISDVFGFRDFFFHANTSSDPLGYSIRSSLLKKENTYFKSSNKVLSLAFTELLASVPKISCLKIDIEGAERDIWPSIVQNFERINFLLLEIHDLVNPGLRSEFDLFVKNNDLQGKWTANWQ